MGEQVQHTPRPWSARRIVAAVNAVEGIPTEALEAGVVREMAEALELLRQAWVTGPDEPMTSAQVTDLRVKASNACTAVLAKLRGVTDA